MENFVKSPQEEVISLHYTERIRALREDNDLSQAVVAKAIPVAQTTYSDYEKGHLRMPIEIAIDLAIFYDVDINYLLGIINIKKKYPKKD